MRGAIILLPNMPSWRGAQLKSRGTTLRLPSYLYFETRPDEIRHNLLTGQKMLFTYSYTEVL
jgi:hypothetical protein